MKREAENASPAAYTPFAGNVPAKTNQQKAQAVGGQYFGRQIGDPNSQIQRTFSLRILWHLGAAGWVQI